MTDPLHVIGYNKDGQVIKDLLITDATEPVEFYVHQVLHVDGVASVKVNGAEFGDAVE